MKIREKKREGGRESCGNNWKRVTIFDGGKI